ncbi:MAG TPA: efflux RND transporter permease subunit [Alphaproteobacteria bacterium]|nr:efflux RND transporter permease subunit [Alphaproteobacteria bacterium]
MTSQKSSFSENFTKYFITSPLTALLIATIFALGLVALISLPREEEPQISVPMIDIYLKTDGLKAQDGVELAVKPLETIIKAIDGVEHVYSQTQDNQSVLTARFYVGTNPDSAVLRVHERIRAHLHEIPYGLSMPLVVGRSIDDVAMMVLTLSPTLDEVGKLTDTELYEMGLKLQGELSKVTNIGASYICGGRPVQLRIEVMPEKLSLYSVTLNQVVSKVQEANKAFISGDVVQENHSFTITAGKTAQNSEEIGQLLVSTFDGRPVYLKDVADIKMDGKPLEHRVIHMVKDLKGDVKSLPALSIAFSKRAGSNAVVVAKEMESRLEILKDTLLPKNVMVTVTRNYGETATEKSNKLLEDLLGATIAVVVLVTLAIGWREGIVVAVVIPVTILSTLFFAWVMGYTLNRVSLFALIFSIGILVDDAIVFIENIVRHWRESPEKSPIETAIVAVKEVGPPTIMATFTIIAALMPMKFVSGLMGPYMSPIPINASMAMLMSLLVAFTAVPWLLVKLKPATLQNHEHSSKIGDFYKKVATPLINSPQKSKKFLVYVALATLASFALFGFKAVTVKMLPFDNKSELVLQLDLLEGSTLEETQRSLTDMSNALKDLPELTSLQLYIGTAAPFNFNGLVRHSYLRQEQRRAEIQVNLLGKSERSRSSHEISLDIRDRLKKVTLPNGAITKVVEVPPGPPVLATLLAEIYGPDAKTRREVARKVKQAFASIDFIKDIDDSFGTPFEKLHLTINRVALEHYGVEEKAVYDTLVSLLGATVVGYSHRGGETYPIQVSIELSKSSKVLNEKLLTTPILGTKGMVELGDLVVIQKETASYPIFRHNGYEADMVMAELAGRFEAPIYGIFAVNEAIKEMDFGNLTKPKIAWHGQPLDEREPTLLWDGEWEVTYVTFLDMGVAFILALAAIYGLLVAQFKSFKLPLVVLLPVPLVLVGIILGHFIMQVPFTATSMIGLIGLAGIVVRNSLLLVEFIKAALKEGIHLQEALLDAGAKRIQPIALTAGAAMIGALFMFSDPIFQGLATSLFFGLMSSTVLTLLAIPAVYMVFRYNAPQTKN